MQCTRPDLSPAAAAWQLRMQCAPCCSWLLSAAETVLLLCGKPSVLQVLWCDDCLAIMTGINPDAPVGTKLAFVSGGSG